MSSICKKVRYQSRLSALLALMKIDRQGKSEKRAYYCKECKGWHLTSRRK